MSTRLSNEVVNNQINRMISFIENEGILKEEEMDLKSEENCALAKREIVSKELEKLTKIYEKRTNQIRKNHFIFISTLKNQRRIKMLNEEHNIVNVFIEELRKRMVQDLKKNGLYKDLLFNLILKGLVLLLEKHVYLKICEKDKTIAEGLLENIKTSYKNLTGVEVKLEIHKDWLPISSMGGVDLVLPGERTFFTNTFEWRFKKIIHLTMPMIRKELFDYSSRACYV
uniref:V-type proton ATPase subunit E n=1 Tax=Clastoptera arizonana TaxID=38151 RepID=A0A1B6D9D3_9HEMI